MNWLRRVLFTSLSQNIRACPLVQERTRLSKGILQKSGTRFVAKYEKQISTSARVNGVDEFFEIPENIGLKEIKSAAPWSRDLLRLKSLEDLHKLWFVLLKERNMLLTMQHYYEGVDEPMPSPERLEKVAESMSNLRDVLEEREKAKNMLLLGRPTEAHGEYRKSGLGHTYWYEYKPHLMPKQLNKDYYGDRPADIASFDNILQEWHIRFQERKSQNLILRKKALIRKWDKIRLNNPDLPKKAPRWWLAKFHTKLRYGVKPEAPVLFRGQRYRYRKEWVG